MLFRRFSILRLDELPGLSWIVLAMTLARCLCIASAPMLRIVASVAILGASIVPTGCAGDQQIESLQPGVLTVAVTSGAPTNAYDPQLWIRRYVEQFAAERELAISWVVVPFNESWLLASRNECRELSGPRAVRSDVFRTVPLRATGTSHSPRRSGALRAHQRLRRSDRRRCVRNGS